MLKKLELKKIVLKILAFGIIITSFTSCFDEPINSKKIIEDYYLNWVYGKADQNLLKSSDEGKSGSVEIPETVFAIGFNEDFIIAKQHPNLEKEISERLFGKSDEAEGFLLDNPNDTIYLAKDDSIHKKNGKWYHLSNGWNPPDSLKPYRKITFFHIIDLKNNKAYRFNNELDYKNKRDELSVPKDLNFTIVEKELE